MKPVFVKIATISPEYAVELLENNIANRRMDMTVVARYGEDMRNGRWVLNGDPIAIDANGTLLNGQHRLKACAIYGVPFTTAVAFNVAPEAFSTYDDGKPRSRGDIATLAGFRYGSLVAGTAKLFILADLGILHRVMGNNYQTGKQACLEVARSHPEIEDSCAEAKRRRHQFPHIPETHYCFALSYFRRYDANAASLFVERVAEGIALAEDSPEMRLRTVMIQEAAKSRTQMTPVHRLALFIKAWRFSAVGASVKRLSYTPERESFPSTDPTV